jgi:beta-keto acid cleavage enzyme
VSSGSSDCPRIGSRVVVVQREPDDRGADIDVAELGDIFEFSVAAAGRHQLKFCTLAAMLGGNVRVGLQDSLYIGRGRLARTSAEHVTAIREILERLSIEIATPAEARERLRLKGAPALPRRAPERQLPLNSTSSRAACNGRCDRD